jgi:hypothetical protein
MGLPSFQSAKHKIAPATRNQSTNSKRYVTKDEERGGIRQVTTEKGRKFHHYLSTSSSHPSFVISWFEGAEVWLR